MQASPSLLRLAALQLQQQCCSSSCCNRPATDGAGLSWRQASPSLLRLAALLQQLLLRLVTELPPPPHTPPPRTLINIKSIIYDEMKVREEESLGASLLRLVTELEEEEARIQVTLLAASGVIH